MSTSQTSGFDRFNDALKSMDQQIQEIRDAVEDRRQQVSGEFRKRADQFEDDLKKSELYKRLEVAGREIGDQVDRTRSQLYDVFGVASKSDVERLNRRLNTLSKKINELAKDQQPEV